ncbi:MAG: DNA-directed RNA polymerase subunit alpha [Thermoanaerobaculia bacterium]
MQWKNFQRPRRLEVDSATLSPTYGKFTAQPFERGFATTIGNALRRCLLSSIEGAAVTNVHIEGVQHEFSTLAGVSEDITDILLNLRTVPIRLHGDEWKILTVDVKGPAQVTAGDLQGDAQVEIIDPSIHIATLNEDAHLRMQVQVKKNRGYVTADRNSDESMGIGWMPIDSAHSPVRKVNYRVEAARLGQTTDFERLVLEIFSNGTVPPEEAVSLASQLLKEHLGIFVAAEESSKSTADDSRAEELAGMDALLARRIEELNLSVRSANCLKNANIHTLRDLVRRTEKDMLETKNFGRKSLEELQDLLARLGLHFGMNVPERPSADA